MRFFTALSFLNPDGTISEHEMSQSSQKGWILRKMKKIQIFLPGELFCEASSSKLCIIPPGGINDCLCCGITSKEVFSSLFLCLPVLPAAPREI